MTQSEYAYWTLITASSRSQWKLDKVRYHNTGETLIYKGGLDGVYVLIDASGKAVGGKYEGAIPHIAEADFYIQHTRTFSSDEEAFVSLAEHLGISFLLDLLSGD